MAAAEKEGNQSRDLAKRAETADKIQPQPVLANGPHFSADALEQPLGVGQLPAIAREEGERQAIGRRQ